VLRSFEIAAQPLLLAQEPRLLQRTPDRIEQNRRRRGFEHVSEGTHPHGGNGPLHPGVARDHDRLHEGREGPQGGQQREPVAIGEAHVDECHIEGPISGERQGGPAIGSGGRLDVEGLNNLGEVFREGGVVVDDEHRAPRRSGRGS